MVCVLVQCSIDERVISSHYMATSAWITSNYFLTVLWKKIVIQSNSQDIISNEGTGMCSTKYEPNIAYAVVCYIPASFHLIFLIKMIHLLHQQMLWIYYRLVAFHICNRLPLKHDNKSCVKEIAYIQLKTETNHIQLWYTKDSKQFFKKNR